MTDTARHRHHRLRQHLAAYFKLAPLFRGLEVRACADIEPGRGRGAGEGVRRRGADRGRAARQPRDRRRRST